MGKMVRRGNWKLTFDMQGRGELYNLARDPGELRDLIDDPSCREVRLALVEELLRWTIRTEDDLPGGRYLPKRAERNWYAAGGRRGCLSADQVAQARAQGVGAAASQHAQRPDLVLVRGATWHYRQVPLRQKPHTYFSEECRRLTITVFRTGN